MADVQTLQEEFSRAMRRDRARDQLPRNVAYNLVDWIPDLGAHLRKRGGWSYFSDDVAGTIAAATYVIAGLVAPFSAATKHLGVTEDNRLFTVNASNGDITDIGDVVAGTTMKQNPVFHRDKAIFPAGDGTTAPRYYDGSTLGNLAGSPPAAIYATVYKDRTVLGRSSANKERLWFSDAGDPASWDTTNTYWDTSFPVTGLASLKNAILAFSEDGTEKLVGSTPPPDSDFFLASAFTEGTPDARSIAYWGDNVVFANPSGIFITDGSALDDVTKAAGMLSYWQELLAGHTSSWTLSAGVHQGYYVISVMDGSTFKDAAMIDLQRRTWLRVSNLKAVNFWASSAPDELYFGLRSAARVGKFSTVFMPSASVKNDGDGTAVTPVYESPFFRSKGKQLSWKRVYLDYDIRDAASDNPTLTVSYVETPEATSYTTVGSAFAETSAQIPARRDLGQSNYGMGFRVVQTNASADTRLSALRAEVHEREGSRIT